MRAGVLKSFTTATRARAIRAPRTHLVVLVTAFLPGLLTGTEISGLIFFLNPELPFSPLSLLRGILYYGLAVGLFTVAILAPFTWGRPRRALRWLPWSLTGALAVGAILGWSHASYFSYYLPPGINVQLLKAALWLSLATLIFFYTSLLHTFHSRPYGRRSTIGLAMVVLASIFTTVERREAFEPPFSSPPRASAIVPSQRPTLLVVGIDQASLDAILPLAEQGHLPFLAGLIRDGSHGRLETFTPVRQATQWTTLITGKLPYKHGILDDRIYSGGVFSPGAVLRLVPVWAGFRAWGTLGHRSRTVDADERRSTALWEILQRLGVPTGVVGWPVSYPAAKSPLFAFSDRFFRGDTSADSALPPEMAERGLLFRVDSDELDPGVLENLRTTAARPVSEALAEDLWRHSIASFSQEQHPDLRALFVHLPGLATVSERNFGGFSAVQFDGVQGQRYETAHQRTIAYYSQLDGMLRRLWEGTQEPRLLAVVSAYGVEPAGGLKRLYYAILRRAVLEGTVRGAPDGSLLLLGNGIEAGSFLSGTRAIDIVPTLLYGLGFPIARDLDGRVITSAFEQSFLATHPLMFVPSYGTVEPLPGVAHEFLSEIEEEEEADRKPAPRGPRNGRRQPRNPR